MIADERYQCFVDSFYDGNAHATSLCIKIVPSNRSKSPIHTIGARIGLAASSSKSINQREVFLSLIESFCILRKAPGGRFQLEEFQHIAEGDGDHKTLRSLTIFGTTAKHRAMLAEGFGPLPSRLIATIDMAKI